MDPRESGGGIRTEGTTPRGRNELKSERAEGTRARFLPSRRGSIHGPAAAGSLLHDARRCAEARRRRVPGATSAGGMGEMRDRSIVGEGGRERPKSWDGFVAVGSGRAGFYRASHRPMMDRPRARGWARGSWGYTELTIQNAVRTTRLQTFFFATDGLVKILFFLIEDNYSSLSIHTVNNAPSL